MTVRLSDGMRNAVLAAIVSELGDGTLEFRSGAQPASANAASAGTLLAAADLTGGFAAPASGTVAKTGVWEDPTANAAGTIGHARFKRDADAGGATPADERIDFSVTATGGGGDITVDNTVVAVGQKITVTSFSLTMPASTS